MIKKIFTIVFVTVITFSSCNTTAKNTDNAKQTIANGSATVATTEQDIPYTIANRYFVRNDYKKEDHPNPKITTQEEFKEVFGMATIVGPDGKPTPVDFSRQYVLSVIGALSDRGAIISPVSLKQQGDTIYLKYKITEGEKSLVTIKPMLLIIVENKYQGEIKLVEN